MLCFVYCILSSSYSKDNLSFWQFWKIMNLSRILKRDIGRVDEGWLRARVSSISHKLGVVSSGEKTSASRRSLVVQ